jgi:peptidyl-prolyl cis-trans isomerase A (cyclophilin A)
MRKSLMKKGLIALTIPLLLHIGCGSAPNGGSFNREALMDPKSEAMNQTAPDKFKAKFITSEGDFVVEVTREWAPLGADRFYNLVFNRFYDNVRFFRVIPNFMAQFGINGDPEITAKWVGHPQRNPNWQDVALQDDPVNAKNERGTLTFGNAGPNTRTTQVFINFNHSAHLDGMGFAPFGQVVEGMETVDAINPQYRELPNQDKIMTEGNAYLEANFPELTYIKTARIID